MSNRRRLRAPDRLNSRAGTVPLRESATAVLERPETATVTLREANTSALSPAKGVRRYRARLIAGDTQGARGWYGSPMLRETAAAKVFHSGLRIFADHPTETEEIERPERSIRDLAGRLVTDAVYESDGLYADVEVYPMWVPLVEAMADTIGLSIRAKGTVEHGKPQGQRGPLVTSITFAESVDFVTAAGAGGALVSLLESARTTRLAESRNVGGYFEARIHLGFTEIADGLYSDALLTRDERITLSSAIGDALAAFTARVTADAPQLYQRDLYDMPPDTDADVAESTRAVRLREATADETRQALSDAITDLYGTGDPNCYVWVRDYDPDSGLVWYDAPDDGDQATWQQAYTATGTPLEVTLADTRSEVVARTVYDPAPPDAEDAAGADPSDIELTAVEESALAVSATTPDAADGAPPTVSTQPVEEGPGMTGTQNTGPEPGAAGTASDTTVSTAIAEAQRAQTTAEAERDTALREAAIANARIARYDAVRAARPIATAALAESSLTPGWQARLLDQILADVPLTEAHALDTAALAVVISEAISRDVAFVAAEAQSSGQGSVSGLGGSKPVAALDEATRLATRAARFRSAGMSESAALVAAKGGRI